jgi:hypothetical protein
MPKPKPPEIAEEANDQEEPIDPSLAISPGQAASALVWSTFQLEPFP